MANKTGGLEQGWGKKELQCLAIESFDANTLIKNASNHSIQNAVLLKLPHGD